MRCITCDAENMLDALYCRACGNIMNRCASCDTLIEHDALYCRKCGESTGALPENPAGEANRHEEQRTADTSKTAQVDEVDFTTRVSARRVEPIPQRRGRATRAALYVAVVLVVAGVLAAVAMMWINMQATQRQLAEQRATLAGMEKLIVETRDADRKATYEQLNQLIKQSQDEQRQSMMADVKKFVDERLEAERRAARMEMTTTVAQAQREDQDNFVKVLTAFRSKAGTRLRPELDRIIAIYSNKVGGNAPRDKGGHNVRSAANPWSGSVRSAD